MRAKHLLCEFYEPADDKLNQAELSDTRRPRLTLKHLNKLRKLRDIEREERAEHLKIVQVIYKNPDENA